MRELEKDLGMATLQRSATTFRRSGSSGMVWDEKFLAREFELKKIREESDCAEKDEIEVAKDSNHSRSSSIARVGSFDRLLSSRNQSTKEARKKPSGPFGCLRLLSVKEREPRKTKTAK